MKAELEESVPLYTSFLLLAKARTGKSNLKAQLGCLNN
jgi:hypothetical protein